MHIRLDIYLIAMAMISLSLLLYLNGKWNNNKQYMHYLHVNNETKSMALSSPENAC